MLRKGIALAAAVFCLAAQPTFAGKVSPPPPPEDAQCKTYVSPLERAACEQYIDEHHGIKGHIDPCSFFFSEGACCNGEHELSGDHRQFCCDHDRDFDRGDRKLCCDHDRDDPKGCPVSD